MWIRTTFLAGRLCMTTLVTIGRWPTGFPCMTTLVTVGRWPTGFP
jgi:hypothetical protein